MELNKASALTLSAAGWSTHWGEGWSEVKALRRLGVRELSDDRILVEEYGMTLAEAARELGVSTAAISLTLSRGK